MVCHFMPSRMLPIKRIETTDLNEDVKKLEWKSAASWNVKCLRHFEYNGGTFHKVKQIYQMTK